MISESQSTKTGGYCPKCLRANDACQCIQEMVRSLRETAEKASATKEAALCFLQKAGIIKPKARCGN